MGHHRLDRVANQDLPRGESPQIFAAADLPDFAGGQSGSGRLTGNLLTSAALLGVDACPMEGFVPAEVDKVLALPAQGLASVVCCALGYRRTDDKYADAPKVRFSKSELVKRL